jgi:fatty-acyl-CoA synthase
MKTNGGSENNSPLKAWIHALELTAPIRNNPHVTLPIVIEQLGERFGDRLALSDDYAQMSYRALSECSRQYSLWGLSQGLGPGDVVALMMPNSAKYFAIWLGLTRIGVVVALINTNLAGEGLAHAINCVKPKHIVVSADLAEAYAAVCVRIGSQVQNWIDGAAREGFRPIDGSITADNAVTLRDAEYRHPSIGDRALYIYTSGTTDLPKAAVVSHFRLLQWSYWFAGMMDARPDDRMLNCLPMYHSAGGVAAIGAMLVSGGSVVIRRKFSTRRFWNDVAEFDCTLFQYIGELCRYLVNAPLHPREASHHIRLCCGNGLRVDVWERFQRRFKIPQILEFYASTEGNVSLYNCEGKPGAIGRIPGFLAHRSNVTLVKFDYESQSPARNGEGFCVRCETNEIGEAIGKILADDSNAMGQFEGYADRVASEKKVIRDVFESGDAWFRTGDLMRMDEHGYFYFADRIGDTFRWKGENVAALEVANRIAEYPGVSNVVVYGVEIPGSEGKACMAAIVACDGFDLTAFRRHLAANLPDYASPLFLRFCAEIQTTGTFKARTRELASEGYAPGISDPLFFNDHVLEEFVELDSELYARLLAGAIRI